MNKKSTIFTGRGNILPTKCISFAPEDESSEDYYEDDCEDENKDEYEGENEDVQEDDMPNRCSIDRSTMIGLYAARVGSSYSK